ncbi:MAG: beta-lactamase family protein [Clostridiales bacterium]|nr:beta-lactamase family protein [Clostridiales bacterium]
MLTGLTVACGDADHSLFCFHGNAREYAVIGGRPVLDAVPLHENTLYDLASLTKVFTAVAVLQLVEDGSLRLQDPIAHVDPRFHNLSDTTVFEALSYQAVLRSPQRIDEQADAQAAREQLFQTVRYTGPEPAKIYSDMNALVLGCVVERVSGLPLYGYLKQRILEPCGMAQTYAAVPPDCLKDCPDYNWEYQYVNGRHLLRCNVTPGSPHDPKARLLARAGMLCGHAGLFSTVGDMIRFAQGLLNGKLLSNTMLMEMGINRTGRFGDGRPYRQFLGYLVFSKSPDQHLSEVPGWMGRHAFGISGYTGNHFALDPQQGVFDVFLGNRCHHRLTTVEPHEVTAAMGLDDRGAGQVCWSDGRLIYSSYRYFYQKDNLLHTPVHRLLKARGWIGSDSRKES